MEERRGRGWARSRWTENRNLRLSGTTGSLERQTAVSFVYRLSEPLLELVSTWRGSSLPGPVEHDVTITNKLHQSVTLSSVPTISIHLAAPRTARSTSGGSRKARATKRARNSHRGGGERILEVLALRAVHNDRDNRDAIPCSACTMLWAMQGSTESRVQWVDGDLDHQGSRRTHLTCEWASTRRPARRRPSWHRGSRCICPLAS